MFTDHRTFFYSLFWKSTSRSTIRAQDHLHSRWEMEVMAFFVNFGIVPNQNSRFKWPKKCSYVDQKVIFFRSSWSELKTLSDPSFKYWLLIGSKIGQSRGSIYFQKILDLNGLINAHIWTKKWYFFDYHDQNKKLYQLRLSNPDLWLA